MLQHEQLLLIFSITEGQHRIEDDRQENEPDRIPAAFSELICKSNYCENCNNEVN